MYPLQLPAKRGADVGADSCKLARSLSPKDVLAIPNFLLREHKLLQYGEAKDPLHGLHLSVLESPCGVTGDFVFGSLAATNGGTPLDPRVSKTRSEHIKHGLIAMLAADAAQTGARSYWLVLGVPMLDWGNPEERAAFGRQFKGTYRLRFHEASNPTWAAVGEITFTVDRLRVAPEGALALSTMPALPPQEEWVMLSDCGGSTWDGPVYKRLADGEFDLRSEHSGTAPIGLNRAMDDMTAAINRRHGWNLSRQEIGEALALRGGDIMDGRLTVNILPYAEQHLSPIAQDVAVQIKQVRQGRPGIATVYCIGGGSVVLWDLLLKATRDLWAAQGHEAPYELRLVPNAREANAIGFYREAVEKFGHA